MSVDLTLRRRSQGDDGDIFQELAATRDGNYTRKSTNPFKFTR